LKLVDDPLQRLDPTGPSDLVRIGAERWHTVPRNVRKKIIVPAKPVMHMAIALRERVLERRALALRRAMALSTPVDSEPNDDLLTRLLSCPQWVLPTIENSNTVAQTWSVEAAVYPSWQSIDPADFFELQPTVD
jgi:hypothetical protein